MQIIYRLFLSLLLALQLSLAGAVPSHAHVSGELVGGSAADAASIKTVTSADASKHGLQKSSGSNTLYDETTGINYAVGKDGLIYEVSSLSGFNPIPLSKPLTSAPNTGGAGSLTNGTFAQVKAKPTKAYSEAGQRKYTELAGEPIDTVQDLTNALKSGRVKPSDIEVDFVMINGKPVIANTRTSTALTNADIPQSKWNGVNKTGQEQYPGKSYLDAVQDQLSRNKGEPISPGDW